ncbi:MAG TPA: DUF3306 domain-containing protein [Xanthobacteraceae bacterium]|jgi:hypothetical protein|nr:DUF3306 domain-containing protein [Xanthobacteraceae bacterium]
MSDPKDFLTRWSQRKLNPPAEKPAPEEKAPMPAADRDAAATAPTDPEFDITKLPSLESIGSNSDIRAFLQRGVPASLTRAALRRAWSADPAIRDFVGLSENSWDFNAPNSLPGFGSLNADEVRQAAARFFGDLTEETTGQAPADMPESAGNCGETEQVVTEQAMTEQETQSGSGPSPASTLRHSVDIAAQHEHEVAAQHKEDKSAEAPAPVRRHGGALPK